MPEPVTIEGLSARVDQIALALVELRNLCAKLFVITEGHRNVLSGLAKLQGVELVNANSDTPVLKGKPN
jgi:hypothetical protein